MSNNSFRMSDDLMKDKDFLNTIREKVKELNDLLNAHPEQKQRLLNIYKITDEKKRAEEFMKMPEVAAKILEIQDMINQKSHKEE